MLGAVSPDERLELPSRVDEAPGRAPSRSLHAPLRLRDLALVAAHDLDLDDDVPEGRGVDVDGGRRRFRA